MAARRVCAATARDGDLTPGLVTGTETRVDGQRRREPLAIFNAVDKSADWGCHGLAPRGAWNGAR